MAIQSLTYTFRTGPLPIALSESGNRLLHEQHHDHAVDGRVRATRAHCSISVPNLIVGLVTPAKSRVARHHTAHDVCERLQKQRKLPIYKDAVFVRFTSTKRHLA